MPKPKKEIMKDSRKAKRESGLEMVGVQFWVKKRHKKKAKIMLDAAVDSLLQDLACNQKSSNGA